MDSRTREALEESTKLLGDILRTVTTHREERIKRVMCENGAAIALLTAEPEPPITPDRFEVAASTIRGFLSICENVFGAAVEPSREALNILISNLTPAEPEPCEDAQYSYASKQRTACAVCGERKHTPLRRDEMGGYVCLTCIDERLDDYDVSEKILDEIKKRDAHIKQVIMWAEGCIDEAHTPDFVELSHVIESANSALYHNTDQFEHEWDALTKEEMWHEIQDIRCLVDADGTMSICSSIESYASQVADKREVVLRADNERLKTRIVDLEKELSAPILVNTARLADQLSMARANVETLRETLREALKPFAEIGGVIPENWNGKYPLKNQQVPGVGFRLATVDEYRNATKALAATEPKPVDFCTWTEEQDSGVWNTFCGEAYYFEYGPPNENHHRYCGGCGKPIKQVPFVYKDEEDEEPKP